ncbi:DENN domain-containing protein 3-like [Lampetra fluviatilis]
MSARNFPPALPSVGLDCDASIRYLEQGGLNSPLLTSPLLTSPRRCVQVLDTDVFDLFLKDRLAQKADSFSRLENKSSSWSQKMKQEMLRSLRRCTTEERARQQPRPTSAHLGEGVTTTHPGEEHDPSSLAFAGPAPPVPPMEPWGPDPWDDGAVFTLPPLPPDPLLPGEGQRYCEGLCAALGAALGQVAPSRWGLRAALHAVRAGARLASRQPELALHDLHSISKMDKSVVPPDEARRILLLLPTWARAQVEERAELRWLLQEEVDEPALPPHAAGPTCATGLPDGRVRSFALPSAPLSCDELGTCVREAGITCDPATVGRLFGALTNGRGEVLPADAVRRLYEAWRATERAARELSLPVEALARLDSSEIVYKVSPVVLTSLGQGRVAMTQSRLFLLRDGAAVPFVDIAKFSDIEDVQEVSTLGVLRPRLQALRVVSRRHPGAPFVANLKEQHGPWCLAVREMRAGKRLAHALKDAQFVHRALTNVLLMDAVAQCVRRKRTATAAAMLAHCTREDARGDAALPQPSPPALPPSPPRHLSHAHAPPCSRSLAYELSVESGPLAALDTLDTLVHRVTPAQGKPLAVDALLYVPGELLHGGGGGEGTPPRLWCALSGGRVVVFDAATWTVEHGHLQAGTKRLNRLLCVGGSQVWGRLVRPGASTSWRGHAGGALGCRRHLAGARRRGHRPSCTTTTTTGGPAGDGQHTGVISCSADGHMITWDVHALEAARHVRLPDCRSLTSVQLHGGELWCCVERFVVVVSRAGEERRRFGMINDGCYMLLRCFLLLPEEGKLLAACRNSGAILVWSLHGGDGGAGQPCAHVALPLVSAVTCMIHIKDQVWVGARCAMRPGARACLFVLDARSLRTRQQLEAHAGAVRAMCSAERRYVLSGAGHNDGQVAIWRVE